MVAALIAASLLTAAALAQSPAGGEPPVIAIGEFEIGQNVTILNVEAGLAKQLADKLVDSGCRVIPATALVSWLSGQGIEERSQEAWLKAAKALGARYLLLGKLVSLTTSRVSLSMGFITVRGVSATARISLRALDVDSGQEIAELEGQGSGQGQANLSFQLFLTPTWDVCTPGTLSTNKSTYLLGEPVLIGYQDPAPPGSFYVVVHQASSPGPSWTSPTVSTTTSEPCAQWTWDQTLGTEPADPGFYVVELHHVCLGQVAAAYFEITAQPAGWELELSVGTPEFASTAWGQALNAALDSLVRELLSKFEAKGIKLN
jgi:hypothetical protein